MAKKDKYHTPKDCSVSIGQMIKELEREQRIRKQVYPNQIRQGKLTSETANHRWRCLRDAIKCLENYNGLFVPDEPDLFEGEGRQGLNKYEPE